MWLATTPAVACLRMYVSGTEEGTRLELIWQPVNVVNDWEGNGVDLEPRRVVVERDHSVSDLNLTFLEVFDPLPRGRLTNPFDAVPGSKQ